MRPLVFGIAGGSGCGKTFLGKQIVAELGPENACLISMDQYFRSSSGEDLATINFDHPSHLDFEELIRDVEALRSGDTVWVSSYDFQSMEQIQKAQQISPRAILVLEGLFILAEPIVSLCDLTCFLDVAADERLLGRILRDAKERAASIEEVIDRYQRFVRPSYRVFVEPTMQNADIVVDFTFRRGLFSRMLVSFLRQYLVEKPAIEEFVAAMRNESYHHGMHPEDGFMSMTTDIFLLAEAFPEKVLEERWNRPLSSPAATSIGALKERGAFP